MVKAHLMGKTVSNGDWRCSLKWDQDRQSHYGQKFYRGYVKVIRWILFSFLLASMTHLQWEMWEDSVMINSGTVNNQKIPIPSLNECSEEVIAKFPSGKRHHLNGWANIGRSWVALKIVASASGENRRDRYSFHQSRVWSGMLMKLWESTRFEIIPVISRQFPNATCPWEYGYSME